MSLSLDQSRELLAQAHSRIGLVLDGWGDPSSTIRVRADENLQAALDSTLALDGAEIRVAPGATFDGLILRKRPAGLAPIVIRPDTVNLPAAGCRIDPSYREALIHLRPTVGPGSAITTEPGAEGYTCIGLHPLPGQPGTAQLFLGDDTSANPFNLPHRLVFDRCLVLGGSVAGGKRGMMANTRALTVINSYFDLLFYDFEDAQCICGWNGPGPFYIENNYLRASGENVLFGGGRAMSLACTPSGLVFRHNDVEKDPAWMNVIRECKNLLELKNLRCALIEHNRFRYSWLDPLRGQSGYALVFTPRGQPGVRYTNVTDVTVQYNVIRDCGAGINILATDDLEPTGRLQNVRIVHNLLYDLDPTVWPGSGRIVNIANGGVLDVEIAHNTLLATHHNSFLTLDGAPKNVGLDVHDNLLAEGEYGLKGTGQVQGTPSWQAFTEASAFDHNVIVGPVGRWAGLVYPDGNTIVETDDPVVDGTFHPRPEIASAPTRDGLPIGCDIDGLQEGAA